jgi:SAM-dependent methyltransferase
MAFLKIYRHARQYGTRSFLNKLCRTFPGYIAHANLWRIRRCGCCHRLTIFLTNSAATETRACLFCSANERYELLAGEIEMRFCDGLETKAVLELDPHSPLRKLLSRARCYKRTFYETGRARGSTRADGAICEDITSLTFGDNTFDLIVSSDVLEHVPLLEKAFRETVRVLKPGGVHLFTVPPRSSTKKRAEIIDGEICLLEMPEYHKDPLCPQGILAFWDIGPDLPCVFVIPGLDLRIARGPVGDDGRVVWIAGRFGPS